MPTTHKSPTADDELAFRAYTQVVAYLSSDNQIFWNRSQLFMVGNSAFLGFVFQNFPFNGASESWSRLVLHLLCAAFGLAICWMWTKATEGGIAYLRHWRALAEEFEQEAIGNRKFFRSHPEVPKPGTSKIAILTSWLFAGVWAADAIYLLVVMILKLSRC